jgi:hypothetical protein
LLIIAEALPVSEPVPAVVGAAIIGAMFFSSALFPVISYILQNPTYRS